MEKKHEAKHTSSLNPCPLFPVTLCFSGMFEAAGLEDLTELLAFQKKEPRVYPWFRSLLQPSSHPSLTPQGHPPLVKVLAQFFEKLLGRDMDPMTNVMVTVGAYQALFCCFQALVDEGDEVTQDYGLLQAGFHCPFPKQNWFYSHSAVLEIPK